MIHDAWFTFNGVDSRSMGIIVTKMPETVRAERRVERLEIPGRNGSLHIDEGTYASYDRSMECAVIERRNIDKIAAWLVGAGEMVFSTEPDKLYRVYISNKINIAQMMRVFQKFVVTMDTQPFKYSANAENDVVDMLDEDMPRIISINNPGTVYSEPIITLYGAVFAFYLNGKLIFNTRNIDGYITVDSGAAEVYNADGNQNARFYGEFPRFPVGENQIRIRGFIDRVIIDPRWRWL